MQNSSINNFILFVLRKIKEPNLNIDSFNKTIDDYLHQIYLTENIQLTSDFLSYFKSNLDIYYTLKKYINIYYKEELDKILNIRYSHVTSSVMGDHCDFFIQFATPSLDILRENKLVLVNVNVNPRYMFPFGYENLNSIHYNLRLTKDSNLFSRFLSSYIAIVSTDKAYYKKLALMVYQENSQKKRIAITNHSIKYMKMFIENSIKTYDTKTFMYYIVSNKV